MFQLRVFLFIICWGFLANVVVGQEHRSFDVELTDEMQLRMPSFYISKLKSDSMLPIVISGEVMVNDSLCFNIAITKQEDKFADHQAKELVYLNYCGQELVYVFSSKSWSVAKYREGHQFRVEEAYFQIESIDYSQETIRLRSIEPRNREIKEYHFLDRSLPDKKYKDINNYSIIDLSSASSYQVKPVLFIFWGTWCSRCKNKSSQLLKEIEANDKYQNVNLVFVNAKDNSKRALQYIRNSELKRHVNIKADDYFLKWFGVTSYPYFVLYSKGKYVLGSKEYRRILEELSH